MTSPNPNKPRDLAIDGAIRRLLLQIDPSLSEAEIQARGQMRIGEGEGWYLISFDTRPLALVQLESENQFRLTVI